MLKNLARCWRWPQQRLVRYGGLAGSQAAGELVKLCRERRMEEALEIVRGLDEHDVTTTRDIIYSLLQVCTKQKDLKAATRLHFLIISNGFESDAFLADHLIRLFALCGKLHQSRQVFYKISKATVYSWNAVIQAHVRLGEEDRAIELYELMRQEGFGSDKCTFCCVLKACGGASALSQGMLIHDRIISIGIESDLLVGSALLDMYAKCGISDSACKVFDMLPNHDAVSWGAIIGGHAQHGDGFSAFKLYERMLCQGMEPNQVIFLCLLKACSNVGAVIYGRLIHDHIIRSGFESDKLLDNTLVDMYAKCGSVDEAYKLFCEVTCRDVVSWGAMISGYVQHGYASCAVDLLEEMQQVGIQPSQAIIVYALKACGSLGAVKKGRLINCQIIRDGFEVDVLVGSCLIDMYAKCGSMVEACQVFVRMQDRDVAAWGTLIAGYARWGHGHDAFHLYEKMKQRGLRPDAGIFLSILKACASVGDIEQGRAIHGQAIRYGFVSDDLFGSSLIDMYAKCGSFKEAHKFFSDLENLDVASWGAMIGAYTHHGHGVLALELFVQMQVTGMKPDKVIYLCILKACGSIGALEEGRLIHSQVLSNGLELDMVVGGSLIDMYAKCGGLDEALKVLNESPSQSVVSWAAMIVGCVQHGNGFLALKLFEKMQQKKGIKADRIIYLCVARACASTGTSAEGRLIHDQIIRTGLVDDVVLTNTFVDMYAKCGDLGEACKVFGSIRDPDVVSWGTLIGGYALYGDNIGAKYCLENLWSQGFKLDSMLCTSIVSACSHSGLLEEGCLSFNAMKLDHGITPCIEHYNCMIDLLSRTGRLKEAEDMLQTMSIPPVVTGWMSLITSCRTYGNMDLGKTCFDNTVQLDSAIC